MADEKPDIASLTNAATRRWPKKKKAQLRLLWPELQALIEHGLTLKEIHAEVARVGVTMPYSRFCALLKEIREEEPRESTTPQAGKKAKAGTQEATLPPDTSPGGHLDRLKEQYKQNREGKKVSFTNDPDPEEFYAPEKKGT